MLRRVFHTPLYIPYLEGLFNLILNNGETTIEDSRERAMAKRNEENAMGTKKTRLDDRWHVLGPSDSS